MFSNSHQHAFPSFLHPPLHLPTNPLIYQPFKQLLSIDPFIPCVHNSFFLLGVTPSFLHPCLIESLQTLWNERIWLLLYTSVFSLPRLLSDTDSYCFYPSEIPELGWETISASFLNRRTRSSRTRLDFKRCMTQALADVTVMLLP